MKKIFISLLCLILCACGKPKDESITLTEAHKKFKKICAEENLSMRMFPLSKTVWIYIPLKVSLFSTKSTGDEPKITNTYKNRYKVNYLESTFDKQTFSIDYDIGPSRAYDINYGYGSSYSQEFYSAYQKVLQNILRAYFDIKPSEKTQISVNLAENKIESKPINDYEKKSGAPDFFVVVIADINGGIETQTLFYLEDHKRTTTQSIPPDEANKRFIMEPAGSPKIINDEKGTHLKIHEITWPEFLSKQIKMRVQFLYQYSEFAPEQNIALSIANTAALTFKTYNYGYYDSLILNDLKDTKQKIYTPAEINELKKNLKEAETKGRYQTIKFDPKTFSPKSADEETKTEKTDKP
ncbi:MAG: hypothetical protein HQL25_01615 [Candidatus Omnitrophica bacterium]|nr:hypothetical protein [Candidatus Omnitrophota bacterium]